MKLLLAAGLLLLPAQAGAPGQDKVIDVRAARAASGNTFESMWAAHEKAKAKGDLEASRNVLREIRRLRIERNILALDTFALAHTAMGMSHLKKGDKIRLPGLGIFQVRKRDARMGRNPATGEPIKIKASKKVAFRAAKDLKESV